MLPEPRRGKSRACSPSDVSPNGCCAGLDACKPKNIEHMIYTCRSVLRGRPGRVGANSQMRLAYTTAKFTHHGVSMPRVPILLTDDRPPYTLGAHKLAALAAEPAAVHARYDHGACVRRGCRSADRPEPLRDSTRAASAGACAGALRPGFTSSRSQETSAVASVVSVSSGADQPQKEHDGHNDVKRQHGKDAAITEGRQEDLFGNDHREWNGHRLRGRFHCGETPAFSRGISMINRGHEPAAAAPLLIPASKTTATVCGTVWIRAGERSGPRRRWAPASGARRAPRLRVT